MISPPEPFETTAPWTSSLQLGGRRRRGGLTRDDVRESARTSFDSVEGAACVGL